MGKLFGTNGVRGFANQDMNPELALRLGKSLGTFLKEGQTVLVGTDTRTSKDLLGEALTAGLLSTGVSVMEAGVVPTPALQYAIKSQPGRYAAGAVITASHNPPEFNGIKFIDPDGTEMGAASEEAIEEIYFAQRFRPAPWDRLGAVGAQPDVNERYVAAVAGQVDAAAIGRAKLKVVLDTSNGAGSLTAPYLLRRLGVHVVTLNAQPDGTFPGHDSEPTPDNVRDLVASVKAFGAHLGVVQDGDADRCVFVTEKGEYVWGDRILAMMSGRIAKEKRGGTVVTPVSSSLAVEDYVKANGGKVDYTRVGAPVVARRMKEIGAIFGGEENGGLIFPDHQHCRDASMSLAKILELIARTGQPLSQLLAEVPAYGQHKAKVRCPDAKKQAALAALAAAHKVGRVDTTDGVKISGDGGWVLVRPSGTEPIFRVYAEAKTPEEARRRAEEALREIEAIIARV